MSVHVQELIALTNSTRATAIVLHQELAMRKTMNYFCPLLGLRGPQVAAICAQSVEASADTSETIRFGLQKMGRQKELAAVGRLLAKMQK